MPFQVVTFMRQLCDNQPIVEGFLATLGAGNWGGPPANPSSLELESSGLITRYLSTSILYSLRAVLIV